MKKFSKLIPALLSLPFLLGAYYPLATPYDGLEIISDTISDSPRSGYKLHTLEIKNNKEGYPNANYVSLNNEEAGPFYPEDDYYFNYVILPNETVTLKYIVPEDVLTYSLLVEALTSPVDVHIEGISDLVKESGGYSSYYYSFTFKSDISTKHYYEAVVVFGDDANTFNNMIYLNDPIDKYISVQVCSPKLLDTSSCKVKQIIVFEGEGDRDKERIESISLVVTSVLTSLFFLLIIYGGLALIVMVIIQTAIIKKKSPKKDK